MASIEAEICEEHASEAAFLWMLRDRAVHDLQYDRVELGELDERVEAHVDGLRLAGDLGFSKCLAQLEEEMGPGEAFVAMTLAVERWDLRGIAKVLNIASEDEKVSRGLISAMGWAPFDRVRGILPGLFAGRCPPMLHRIGIGACAAHRQDPGMPLRNALYATDTRLLARALRAVGELGRVELLPEVRLKMHVEDEACRFWAAWTLALLGDADAANALWAQAAGSGAFAERACAMAVRRLDGRAALSWLYSLGGMAGGVRPALAGAASLGDPGLVPWLLECMRQPETARRAGFAFSMITGADLDEEKLCGSAPEGFSAGPTDDAEDEDVAPDPDEGLAWPDAAAVRGWWQREEGRFSKGTRYLWGRPIADVNWLEDVLQGGKQPAREGAAVELLMGRKRKVLVEVRGRG